jgi:biotin transport system substrate-specific component
MAKSRTAPPAVDIALVAVFAALLAALALTPAIPVGGIGVPLTLQTLGVLLAGVVLGPWRGFLSVLLYLAVGFAGLPVFAGGTGGLAVFAKPSIGFLLSFPLAALVAGALAAFFLRRGFRGQYLWLTLAGLVASFVVIYPLGILGMMVVAQLDLAAAIGYNLAFIPGDVVKAFAAAAIAIAVHKAFPALLAVGRPAFDVR